MPKKPGKFRPRVGRAKTNYAARGTSAPTRNVDSRRQTGIPSRRKKRGGKK